MAIFGKKTTTSGGEGEDAKPSSFSPQKAKAFWDRAKVVHESSNYEYAMQLWLNGLGWDPTNFDSVKGFLRSADAFLSENPKGKLDKGTKSGLTAKGDVRKFVDTLLDFGIKKMDGGAALKVTEAAAKIGVKEAGVLLGQHALALANENPKSKKDTYVRLLDAFDKLEAFQLASQAGEIATRLDPSDGDLQARVRNMLAQNTMSKGGFEDTGEEGGFRKNIRDAGKQAELEQEDSIAKSGSVKDQIIARVEAELKERPGDLPTISKYVKALLERGKNADELKAMAVLGKAYKDTGQFRFRKTAGEIQVKRAERQIEKLRSIAEADISNEEAAEKLKSSEAALAKMHFEELKLQVENYPTDLTLKFQLGKVVASMGEHDAAIEQFQQAQDDAKIRRHVQLAMGRSFLAMGGWDDAAIGTFRAGLDGMPDDTTALGMDLRYGLLCALQAKAVSDQSAEAAEEADRIAAGIAMQKFNYKDVRERREQIKSMINEMKA
ncbi:MAG: tetratricopeptide repeat protein [Phycisphaerales bacterium]